MGSIPEGASPEYHCFQYGEPVNGVPIWFNVTYNGVTGDYASAFDDAHYQSNEELTAKYGVPLCGDSPAPDEGGTPPADAGTPPAEQPTSNSPTECRGQATVSDHYNGRAACEWAVGNAFSSPRFADDDCTWFVSQALWVGGLTRSNDWTDRSTNYLKLAIQKPNSSKGPFTVPGPTVTAANAPDLVNYLVSNGLATKQPIVWSDNTARGAQIGDLIAYYWDKDKPVGSISHLSIVTGFDGTYPLVSQHTPAQKGRGWSWSETKHNWIQYSSEVPNPEAFLIHITG